MNEEKDDQNIGKSKKFHLHMVLAFLSIKFKIIIKIKQKS